MIRRIKVGTTVTLAIARQGRAMTVPVTLAPSPKPARQMAKYESGDFEFLARDLVDADAADPRLTGASQGVLVESVSSGGWAALGRLSVGDIILQVDGRAIGNVADLARATRRSVGVAAGSRAHAGPPRDPDDVPGDRQAQ